ncbi:MAG: urea ABC transporter permease subunit UrtB [Pseudomonadota bacterium]
MLRILSLLFLCLVNQPAIAGKVDSGSPELNPIFEILIGKDFSAKEAALVALNNTDHPQRYELIEGLLNARLMLHKNSNRLVWTDKQDKKFIATDALNGEVLGEFKKRKLKKFVINNSLRSLISQILGARNLDSDDPELRLKAVRAMLDSPSPDHAETILSRMDSETNAEVKTAMEHVLLLASLSAADVKTRLAAIDEIGANLQPAVRHQLKKMTDSDPSDAIKIAATRSLKTIESRVAMLGHVETMFFGLSLGSVLVLAAIGLAITFGVMGVINMAHGELIMLGAYTTYLLQQFLPTLPGFALLLSIPAAFFVSGTVGVGIERGVIRFLYGRPLETLLATFGVSLILQQLVRTVISPQNVPVANPQFMSGSWEINSALSLTYNRLYIIVFCLLVFAALFLVLKHTRLGLQVRAVSQNRNMARAMGVHSARVDALTFGLGSGIAGVAGVALSQLTNVGPNLGQAYIVDSFMVVVFGGVGNLWGTLVGGLSLGIANKFMEPWAGAVMAKILILIFVILFIQKRPRGLFPQKGRAVEA